METGTSRSHEGRRSGSSSSERDELRRTLLREPPEIPCKYLYDERGSLLFEKITGLPEYYQTRTELAILEREAGVIASEAAHAELVELGAGAGRKTRLLLDALDGAGVLERCLLMDVSVEMLDDSVRRLDSAYEGVEVHGIVGDFRHEQDRLGPGGDRLTALLAGTIGNLHPRAVPAFLRHTSRFLAPGDHFLVGLDLIKDESRIEAAYNDAAGVTAAFNRNALNVVNERFGGDFDPRRWEHRAVYDERNAWVDIRLRATSSERVRIDALDLELRFEPGDEIRTEISCKYSHASFREIVSDTGLELVSWFTDADELFALALLERRGAPEGSCRTFSRP